MLSLDPLVDNTDTALKEAYKKVIPESEEIRIATGYFYLSGFNLFKDDLTNLRDPQEINSAPFLILMGRQTNTETASKIDSGQKLREQFRQKINFSVLLGL